MIPVLCLLNACASATPAGPGMTVRFGNGIIGTSVLIDNARSADGSAFPNPGSLAPEAQPLRGGKVMGAAPDRRSLPQWVEFSWIELPYESTVVRTKAELDAVPVHRARVAVSERVPAEVVAAVAGTKDRSLWLSFVWQRKGIAFQWEERSGCCNVLRSGGDHIE